MGPHGTHTLSEMADVRHPIRQATEADVSWMAAAATSAFMDDDLWRYLAPDAATRSRALEAFHLHLLAASVAAGAVTVVDRDGWAIWNPPDLTERRATTLTDVFFAIRTFGVCGALRANTLRNALNRSRSTIDLDHWFLDTIVTTPQARGRGIGTSLVLHGLQNARASGQCAYLEATSGANSRLYERLGFVALDPIRIRGQIIARPMVWYPTSLGRRGARR